MSAVRATQIQPKAQAALAASAQFEFRSALVQRRGSALVLRGTESS